MKSIFAILFALGAMISSVPAAMAAEGTGQRCPVNWGDAQTELYTDNGCVYNGNDRQGQIPNAWYANTQWGDIGPGEVFVTGSITLRPLDRHTVVPLPEPFVATPRTFVTPPSPVFVNPPAPVYVAPQPVYVPPAQPVPVLIWTQWFVDNVFQSPPRWTQAFHYSDGGVTYQTDGIAPYRQADAFQTISFQQGEAVYGQRIALDNGVVANLASAGWCYLDVAPSGGTVTAGIINPNASAVPSYAPRCLGPFQQPVISQPPFTGGCLTLQNVSAIIGGDPSRWFPTNGGESLVYGGLYSWESGPSTWLRAPYQGRLDYSGGQARNGQSIWTDKATYWCHG